MMTAPVQSGTANNATPQAAADLAAETLGHDMLDAIVQEYEKIPAAWAKLDQHQQQAIIDRTGNAVRQLVSSAMRILFAGEHPALRAVVESVAFKDGIKAVLKVASTEHHRYELTERCGTPVVLLMVDPAAYFDGMEKIRAQKDQAELPLEQPQDGEEPAPPVAEPATEEASEAIPTPAPSSKDARYEEAVDWVLTHQKPRVSSLQNGLKIGHARAAGLLQDMERNGILGPLMPNGAREILSLSLQA